MKRFRLAHRYLSNPPEEFDESSAPGWLTAADAVRGSTMDASWFWREVVLSLGIGESVDTEFRSITRIK